jgi:Outer membrane efflux protein/Carboxypeptidase regulatory-like domain
MRKNSLITVLSCLAVFCSPFVLPAQTIVTGGFSGAITDPTGATLPGATLTLTSNTTADTYSTVSSPTGGYVFSLLKPGDYTLTAKKEGFKTATQKITVLLGQNSTLNLAMVLGATTTTVEVNEQAGLLQTENANIATTFDTRTVQNIPNPGNDITYIAQTAPGVSMNTSSGNGFGNFSAFGLPGTSNLFTVNGNDYNDPFLNLNNSGASNLLLADQLPYSDIDAPTVEEALQTAYKSRSDFRATLDSQKAAQQTLSAAKGERYPVVAMNGDYSDLGTTFGHSHGNFDFQAGVSVPLFTGGRIKGDITQAEAALRQRKAEAENARGQLDYDVRTAFLNLNAAKEQVDVAQKNAALANENLARSRDRFTSGVTDSVGVVQSEQSLASANDQYITSVYDHNLAKLFLARAIGVARTSYSQYLGGK